MGAFAILVGTGLAVYLLKDVKTTFLAAAAVTSIWALSMGFLNLTAPKPGEPEMKDKRRYLWKVSLVLVVVLDLSLAGWRLNPDISIDYYRKKPDLPNSILREGKQHRVFFPADDERVIKYKNYFVFNSFQTDRNWFALIDTLLPNQNMLFDIASVNNYDPIVQKRYAFLMKNIHRLPVDVSNKLMDLMNVAIIGHASKSSPTGVVLSARGGKPQRVTWMPCAVAVLPGKTSWETLVSENINPEQEVVVDGLDSGHLACQHSGASGKAVVIAETPERIDIEVTAKTDGWLLLADSYYPGWQVFVDNQREKVLRGDFLFRAVPVPAGNHRVVFMYRSVSFYLGAFVSLIIVFGILIVMRRLQPNSRDDEKAEKG